MESISIYCSQTGLRKLAKKLGQASLIQLKSQEKKNDEFNYKIKSEEQQKLKIQYLKKEIKTETLKTPEINKQVDVKSEVDRCYSRLVDLKSTLNMYEERKKMIKEDLRMLEISSRFITEMSATVNTAVINFDFITAISQKNKRNVVIKILRTKLRRNIYIKVYEYNDNTIYIIYVIGEETKRYVEELFKELDGRVFDCIKMLRQELRSVHIDNNKDTGFDIGNKGTSNNHTINNNKDTGVDIGHTDIDTGNKDANVDQRDSKRVVDNTLGDDQCCKPKLLNTDSLPSRTIEPATIIESKGNLKNVRKIVQTLTHQINTIHNLIKTNISTWEYHVDRELRTLRFMSQLEMNNKACCFHSEAWILKDDLKKLDGLKCFDTCEGRFIYAIKEDTVSTKPTYFSNSVYTESFQNLTNVFGVPRYREINPALFLIFTFPFLFGMMFGDVFHGLILLVFSILMIFNYNKLHGTGAFQIILEGRFVVLFCSFFSIWFGFLYGDFASVPIHLFPSQFDTNRTYPFGIDPKWHEASNKMVFINSVKMKLSLIVGFAHMGLGTVLSLANTMYRRDYLDLFCVAAPQALAFFLFLGYLVFLCVYKWVVTINKPSLVNTLISMYTDPFNMKNQMYPGQLGVQLAIAVTIALCIPWMFLSKPVYLLMTKRVRSEDKLDLWITSGIHVVEFGLGLISNTSSYLRLWAVSLAHVQLTSVLHEFTLGSSSWIVRVVTMPIYVTATALMLIGLEGLSSCLHALRLNWIEFFSKFYDGSGTLFKPFNFQKFEED